MNENKIDIILIWVVCFSAITFIYSLVWCLSSDMNWISEYWKSMLFSIPASLFGTAIYIAFNVEDFMRNYKQ